MLIEVEDTRRITTAKLSDFGLSAITGKKMQDPLGTVAYCAPEILLSKAYDKSVDLWSLGAVTFVMLTGEMPFGGVTDQEKAMNVVKCNVDYDDWPPGTHSLDFIQK